MRHLLQYRQSGAECSCGKVFSVWKTRRRDGWSTAHDFQRTLTLLNATARRHADAGNRKATSDREER